LDGLVSWLKQLAVFIVICETVLSFAPNGVYKRYIKPFVGLILLLRISSFLIGTVEVDWNKRIDEVFAGYEESVSLYLENVPVVEENLVPDEEEKGIYENVFGSELKQDLINIDKIVVNPITLGGS